MHEVKAKELTVVLIGRFNPVIINPNWLAGKELIGDLEAKGATESQNYINHPEISQFMLSDSGIQIQTFLDKFVILTRQEGYFDKLHELTVGIFTSLRETPIIQIGINTIHHYEFNDIEEWHSFGDCLAPKELWKSITKNPGLKRIEIRSLREDDALGEINTNVGVSEIFPIRGVRIQVNDHFDLFTKEEQAAGKNINAVKCLEVLDKWKERLTSANQIIEGIMNYEKK